MTEKSNDPIDSSRNRGEFGTQTYNHQNINTAFLEGVKRLEGKFVSKNVIKMSREIYLHLKFPFYPKI